MKHINFWPRKTGKLMDELEHLTAEDIYFFKNKGISEEAVKQQLHRFKKGFPRLEIVRPATLGDGIQKLTREEEDHYIQIFEKAMKSGRAMKFVPASGAATRMFKDLIRIYQQLDTNQQLSHTDQKLLNHFLENLPRFAFYLDLAEVLKRHGYPIQQLIKNQEARVILHYLLTPAGLNYSELPKALLKFHRYNGVTRTPLEEHLVEGAGYVKDERGTVRIHFTVPPRYRDSIKNFIQQNIPFYKDYAENFEINYSVQDPATDTIAVDLQNAIVRDEAGNPLLRPAGHGALLKNLNELQGDIIFIKNIDNVVPEFRQDVVIRYKKVLGGYLVDLQSKVFQWLNTLEKSPTPDNIQGALAFLKDELHLPVPETIRDASVEKKLDYAWSKLNRPIRVCGIVENRGEPGGGPFWIKDTSGEISLQIVESAQVDKSDPLQRQIWESSTHFNPTDLVCGVRDYQGNPFDLMQFRDMNTGIITIKYWKGQEIKVLELPGLWNGSMAHWNTIFVEVPLETFNPVKTVFDLLRPEHLPLESTQTAKFNKLEK